MKTSRWSRPRGDPDYKSSLKCSFRPTNPGKCDSKINIKNPFPHRIRDSITHFRPSAEVMGAGCTYTRANARERKKQICRHQGTRLQNDSQRISRVIAILPMSRPNPRKVNNYRSFSRIWILSIIATNVQRNARIPITDSINFRQMWLDVGFWKIKYILLNATFPHISIIDFQN